MELTPEKIRETFFRQAQTCLKSSLLYHDMLKILGNNEEIVLFIKDIITRREMTGIIEALLNLLAFFHYHTLKYSEGFAGIKKFFKTQGGNYLESDYQALEKNLSELWANNKQQLEKWMLNTKLQTNEIARCSAIYPAIMSLGLKRINLVDLGCSAGLMLLMDLYSYDYFNDREVFNLNRNQPVLRCRTPDPEKLRYLFINKLEIVKKIGIDLFPVDLNDENNVFMLKSALWDDVARAERLEQAIRLFGEETLPNPLLKREGTVVDRDLQKEPPRLFPTKGNTPSPFTLHSSPKGPGESYLQLLQLDYTNDLVAPLETLIDKTGDLVFYCSVSTYQIPLAAYNKLLERLTELSAHLNRNIYFVEFEELRKNQQKNVTGEEPFHITIHTFPAGTSYEFGRAHFHGNSLTIF
jgi:hypothetical protein